MRPIDGRGVLGQSLRRMIDGAASESGDLVGSDPSIRGSSGLLGRNTVAAESITPYRRSRAVSATHTLWVQM
jgi:hypothetical protein